MSTRLIGFNMSCFTSLDASVYMSIALPSLPSMSISRLLIIFSYKLFQMRLNMLYKSIDLFIVGVAVINTSFSGFIFATDW